MTREEILMKDGVTDYEGMIGAIRKTLKKYPDALPQSRRELYFGICKWYMNWRDGRGKKPSERQMKVIHNAYNTVCEINRNMRNTHRPFNVRVMELFEDGMIEGGYVGY